MSQSHHDPVEENIETHPVKLAIAVMVGAVALILGVIMLAHFAIGNYVVGNSVDKVNSPEAIALRIAPVTVLAVDASKNAAPALVQAAATSVAAAAPVVAMAIPAPASPGAATAGGGEGVYKSACIACHGAGIAGASRSRPLATF